MIQFLSAGESAERALAALGAVRPMLLDLLPGAELHHVGSTAIPGVIGKGDLDINLRVSRAMFRRADYLLAKQFARELRSECTGDFTAFKGEIGGVPVDIFLTVMDGEYDFFVPVRDYLRDSIPAREILNALKRSFGERSMDEYRTAKRDFFTRVRYLLDGGLDGCADE